MGVCTPMPAGRVALLECPKCGAIAMYGDPTHDLEKTSNQILNTTTPDDTCTCTCH